MTPNDIVEVLELVLACSPIAKLTPSTPAAWHRLLADVTREQALAAVAAHYRTSRDFITIADVRREVARGHGLLPPVSLAEAQEHHDPLADDVEDDWAYRRAAAEHQRACLAGNLAAQSAVEGMLPAELPTPGPEPDSHVDPAHEAWWTATRDALHRRRDRSLLRAQFLQAARDVPADAGTEARPRALA